MNMTAAAKIESLFPPPPHCVITRNSPPAHQLPTAVLYQGFGVANSNTATGIAACLYDSGRRSRSTSKERDAETGLDFFGARYFSSAQGRFTSPDQPFNDQAQGDPQSWNLYSYVRNNPLRFTDPTGTTCVGSKGSDGSTITEDNGDGKGCAAIQQQTATVNAATDDYLAFARGVARAGAVTDPRGIAAFYAASATGGLGLYAAGAFGSAGLIELGVATGPLAGVGLTPQARAYGEELIAAGHKVVALPTNSITKMADFVIDGIVTEYKGLTAAGPTTVKNAIEKAAQQGKAIVIDARNVGVTAQNALQQIQRAQGNIGGLQGRVTVLTKEGPVKY
jgi:RHS repeat-associated protein